MKQTAAGAFRDVPAAVFFAGEESCDAPAHML
jgi:hypothetical protein